MGVTIRRTGRKDRQLMASCEWPAYDVCEDRGSRGAKVETDTGPRCETRNVHMPAALLGFVLKQVGVRDTSPTRERGTRYGRFH